MPLTREEIVRAMGEIDDVTAARIIATGATLGELAEAQTWIANDEALINSGRRLPAGRVGQLAEVLMILEEEKQEPPR